MRLFINTFFISTLLCGPLFSSSGTDSSGDDSSVRMGNIAMRGESAEPNEWLSPLLASVPTLPEDALAERLVELREAGSFPAVDSAPPSHTTIECSPASGHNGLIVALEDGVPLVNSLPIYIDSMPTHEPTDPAEEADGSRDLREKTLGSDISHLSAGQAIAFKNTSVNASFPGGFVCHFPGENEGEHIIFALQCEGRMRIWGALTNQNEESVSFLSAGGATDELRGLTETGFVIAAEDPTHTPVLRMIIPKRII